jgi:hypothetical protein
MDTLIRSFNISTTKEKAKQEMIDLIQNSIVLFSILSLIFAFITVVLINILSLITNAKF